MAPRSPGNWNAGRQGNLPAIATHGGIEPALCTWRWQAGGGQVFGIRQTAKKMTQPIDDRRQRQIMNN
jgi:hypothetical protein